MLFTYVKCFSKECSIDLQGALEKCDFTYAWFGNWKENQVKIYDPLRQSENILEYSWRVFKPQIRNRDAMHS